MNRRHWLAGALMAATIAATPAFAQTTLRMTWYSDGNEGEVMRDLLNRFEASNPGIKVVLDTVPFKAINENLPVQLAAGQGRIWPASSISAALRNLRSICARISRMPPIGSRISAPSSNGCASPATPPPFPAT